MLQRQFKNRREQHDQHHASLPRPSTSRLKNRRTLCVTNSAKFLQSAPSFATIETRFLLPLPALHPIRESSEWPRFLKFKRSASRDRSRRTCSPSATTTKTRPSKARR